jgi:hypothetical protein
MDKIIATLTNFPTDSNLSGTVGEVFQAKLFDNSTFGIAWES